MSNRKINTKIMATDISNISLQGELFKRIDETVVPGVFDYYLISNYGRIYNPYLNLFLKPGISGSGYQFVYLATIYGPKLMQVHRLVMLSFYNVPNSENLQVNHKDGNKLNNIYTNLEWITRSENVRHAFKNNLNYIGEDRSDSKITNETAKRICELLQENIYTNKEIADMCGTTINIVAGIKSKKCWKHISNKYIFNRRVGRLFTDEMIINLCKYFENNPINNLSVNDHCRNALNFYGYDNSDHAVDSIRKLYNRKYYTHISKDFNF